MSLSDGSDTEEIYSEYSYGSGSEEDSENMIQVSISNTSE